jgi:hypothetical protein
LDDRQVIHIGTKQPVSDTEMDKAILKEAAERITKALDGLRKPKPDQ